MRKLYLFIIGVMVLTGCSNSINSDSKVHAIPANAIPIIYNEYILAQGSVNNTHGSFLVDLGSDQFILDSVFINSNYLKNFRKHHSTLSGIGNSSQNVNVIKDSITFSLKNLHFRTSNVPVANLKQIGGDLIDGLIGTDFFKQHVFFINYADEYINLFDNIDSVNVSGYKIIPMKKMCGFYSIPLTVNINDTLTIKGNFIVDTGSPSSTLTTAVAEKYNLKNKIKRKVRYYTSYGGVGGASSGYDFCLESLKISEYCLKNAIMSFSEDTAGLLSENKYLGILGNNVLERFDIIFDFKNNNLFLKPNNDFAKPFTYDRFGFFYVDRSKAMGGWLVTGMVENSQAEKLGLRIDDKIVSINGIPVDKISYKDEKDAFSKLDKVKFVVKRADTTRTIEYKLIPLL